nr:hypothetical protein [Salipaludibacillus sp. CUR1]
MKLDISPEKSKIINLRKKESEFLGFTIRANRKRKTRVAHTKIKESKKRNIKARAKELIQKLRASPTSKNALLFNSFVLGTHNYFNRATHVYGEFSRIAYQLKAFIYNRLKDVGKYGHPSNPPPTYKKFYSQGMKTFKVCGVYLFPLADVKTSNSMNFSQSLTPFTKEGRERIYKKLRGDIQYEISILMKSKIPTRSVEYMDNRISRYSMKLGKCEITGMFLTASEVNCHHYTPVHLGGDDKFNNLRILHQEVHKIIHLKDTSMIESLTNKLKLTKPQIKKINNYRKNSDLDPIQ